MHNKSFTADNQVTILGGRNIGDEYSEAQPDVDLRDRDLVAIGPVVCATRASPSRAPGSASRSGFCHCFRSSHSC